MKLLVFVLIVRSRSVMEIASETVQKASQETLSSCVYIHILNNSGKSLFKVKKTKGLQTEINNVFSSKLVLVGNREKKEPLC